MKSSWFILAFVAYSFDVITKKSLPRLISRSFSLFSSRTLMISGLTFKPLNHFKLIFVSCKIGIQSHSFVYGYSVFLTPFTEEIFFYHCVFLMPLSKISWSYMQWAYFGTLSSVPLLYVLVFMSGPYRFDYYSFVIQFETRKCNASSFVLSVHCFWFDLFRVFVVPYKF